MHNVALDEVSAAVDGSATEQLQRTAVADLHVPEVAGTPERLAAILEMTPDLVSIADPAGRLQYLNPAGRRLLGIGTGDDITHTTIADFHCEKLANALRTEILPRAAEAGSWIGETSLLRRDGSSVPVSQAVIVHKDARGEIQFISTVARDITERKRIAGRLLLREQALEAVSEGIVVTAPWRADNPIVYVNPAFERISGYKAHDVLGRNSRFLTGPDTDAQTVQEIRRAIKDQEPFKGELLTYRADGTPFWSAIAVAPLRDDQGHLLYFVVVMSDVSLRRQLEEQVRQSQKMEAIGRLAGGVAHDFNNVLTVILGCAARVEKILPAGNPAIVELLHDITDAGNRATLLTRQLLAFSRKQVLAPRSLSLNRLIMQLENMLRNLVGEEIEVAYTLAAQVDRVVGDQSQLEQVFLNLAVNSRDAMPHGGTLSITSTNVELYRDYVISHPDAKPGPHVLISVTDTGTGMAANVAARAFEPFFTTKKPGEGTGMGLATVFGIVQQSGGHITVSTELGCGTTFRIYLPQADTAEIALEPDPSDPSAAVGTETILLVEDEERVLRVARHFLQDCGYTVLCASSGASACEAAARHPGQIDLLVADVVMPEMGGPEVASRLSALRPGIKILYVSGYTDDAILRRGILKQDVQFLQKPYDQGSLSRMVRQVLDS